MLELMNGRWVRLQDFPALSIVQLHPVVLAILHLAGALQCLGEQFTQIVVVWRVLKAKVPDVAQVLVELLCDGLVCDNCK